MEYPGSPPEDVEFLKAADRPSHVSAGESNRDLHSRDESYLEPHRPDVVVWPQGTEDVVAAVRLAARKGYAVTPWCAGTSLEGNPIPLKGGICLDFTVMNRIMERPRGEDPAGRRGARRVVPGAQRAAAPPRPLFPRTRAPTRASVGMIGNHASGGGTVALRGHPGLRPGAWRFVMADGEVCVRLGAGHQELLTVYDLLRLMVGMRWATWGS
jgi:D-lactate dehydrogenase (cytochrome)